MKFAIIILGICVTLLRGWSASIPAASPAYEDVARAVSLAQFGDTVLVPEGTAVWSSPVLLTTGIRILGAGTNKTLIVNGHAASQGLESPLFDIKLNADGYLRISGFRFQDQNLDDNSDAIRMGTGAIHERQVRIDNCMFEGFSFAIKVNKSWGVCDNCLFVNNDVLARVRGSSTLTDFPIPGAPWGWNSTNYFVFENIVGVHKAWNQDTYLIDSEFPANYMVRHSDFYEDIGGVVGIDGFDMHAENNPGVVPFGIVIYSNRWTYTGNLTVNSMRIADIRGGANSLVYSNQINGVTGYITVRDDPTSGPLTTNNYFWQNWGNGQNVKVVTGNGTASGVNFQVLAPNNFVQLQFPHPLRSIDSPNSGNPDGVSVLPTSLDFGLARVGETRSNSVTVRNSSTNRVSVTAAVTLPFSIAESSPLWIDPGASRTLTVRYSPTAQRSDSAILTVASINESQVSLRGSAIVSQQELSFSAASGLIVEPFLSGTDGSVSQNLLTLDPATGGSAVYDFVVPNAGMYNILIDVWAPSSDGDSLFVNIDSQPSSSEMIWDIPVNSNYQLVPVTWRGTDGSAQSWTLAAGAHRLFIRGREPGVRFKGITISAAVVQPSAPTGIRISPP
jgi:hypothetical protein